MNIKYLNFLIVIVLASFLGCTVPEETDPNYISVDDNQYRLKFGKFEDRRTNLSNLTYRMYDLMFQDREINPQNYIQFRIYSNSTTRLQEGVYVYDYDMEEALFTSYLHYGVDLQYDAKDVIVAGNIYQENFRDKITGTVKITKKNGSQAFEMDFTIENTNGKITRVKGYFNEPLVEDYISWGDPQY